MGGGKKKSEEEEIFFQGIMLLLYTGKSIKYDQEQSLFGTFEKSVNFDGKKKKTEIFSVVVLIFKNVIFD